MRLTSISSPEDDVGGSGYREVLGISEGANNAIVARVALASVSEHASGRAQMPSQISVASQRRF